MSEFIDRTGEKRMMNCGLMATIIIYRHSKDIDVLFENKEIVRHKKYDNFLKGNICPSKKSHIGEKRIANCGLLMEIISFNGWRDIDVKFSDGQIVEHKQYNDFLKGQITSNKTSHKISHLGEKLKMKCGLTAEIIRYGGYKDIDVRFEDGQVVKHRKYESFKKRQITPPNNPSKITHLGEVMQMKCGLKAKITRYKNARDIDVEFEDEQTVTNKQYVAFTSRTLSHPGFNCSSRSSIYRGLITRFYSKGTSGLAFFHCKCQNCGFEIIDTARNIIKLEHKCEITAT